MNALRTIAVSVFVLTLAGCATSVPINDRQNPTGVGVHITVRAPIRIFTGTAETVYIVSVDSNGNLNNSKYYRSNFSRGGRVYFLNVESGEYAIAGASIRLGMTYLTVNSIKKTRFKVLDGHFTFIGNVVLDDQLNLDGVDLSQANLSNLNSTGAGGFWLYANENFYGGEIFKIDNSMESRNKFIEKAKKDLAGGGWESLFR